MRDRSITRDIDIDRQYKQRYARENGKRLYEHKVNDFDSNSEIERAALFKDIFKEYQEAKLNNDIAKKNELLNKLFTTKENRREFKEFVTVCLDKILNYKIETYKRIYHNKLAVTDINAICFMLIYEFLETPEKFIKKYDSESIFTTLTRAMRNMLDKEYENNVGKLKLKVANGKRISHNSVQYEESFEIEASDKHDEVYEKTYLNDAAYQEWQKSDNIAESKEFEILKHIYNNQELFKNSPRQKEIFYLLAQGLNQKDVSSVLNCKESNISQQKKKVKNKISKHYGYEFGKQSTSDIDFTVLTKAIISIFPEMDDNVTYRKDIDYFAELNRLLEFFEYNTEKVNIQSLFLNKIDQSENIADIVLFGLIKNHRQLFINGILGKNGLTPGEALKLYWHITNAFDEYIKKINIDRKLLSDYIAFRKEYIDIKIEKGITG